MALVKYLTQEELAEKLYIDKKKVSRWECGTSTPEFELLIKLAEILDVSLYELSICQRVKNDKISQRLFNKFNSIKDLKKLKIKNIIKIILILLVAVFFLITTIYTFKNNGTVEVYELKSVDEQFFIEGKYIKINDYSYFNIKSIYFLEEDKVELNKLINNCDYEIYDNTVRLIKISRNNSFINEETDYQLHDDSISSSSIKNILQIKANCKINEKNQNYTINFKLVKKYDNKLF